MATTLIAACWIAWYAYWIRSAIGNKPVRHRESRASEALYRLPLVLAVVLLLLPPRFAGPALSVPLLPRGAAASCLAVTLVVSGLTLAIWARRHLAGNWSARVTVKERHELIRTGPYRWVRHPIYTGMLVALLGTIVAIDTPLALAAFALIVVSFIRKLQVEERFMAETFGTEYEQYRRETARLVPFLW